MPSKLDGSELESSRAVAEAPIAEARSQLLARACGFFLAAAVGGGGSAENAEASSSFMMMKSSPSILISVPEYLPNRMRSSS